MNKLGATISLALILTGITFGLRGMQPTWLIYWAAVAIAAIWTFKEVFDDWLYDTWMNYMSDEEREQVEKEVDERLEDWAERRWGEEGRKMAEQYNKEKRQEPEDKNEDSDEKGD